MGKLGFGTEDLSEIALRDPFIGEIIGATHPCNCEICMKGVAALAAEGKEARAAERLHVEIEPLTRHTEPQHEWYTISTTKTSKWGRLNEALIALGIIDASGAGLTKSEDLIGMVFYWEDGAMVTRAGKVQMTRCWLPTRAVPPDEVEEIKGKVKAGKVKV